MTGWIKNIFRYRLHVAALAGLLTLAPFKSSLTGFTLEAQLASLAMALVMAAIYLSNKVTDMQEDAHNPAALPVDREKAKLISILALACLAIPLAWLVFYPAVLATYLIFGGLIGYFYNYGIKIHGKRWRFKEKLLIKNLSSALLWTGCTSLPYRLLAPDYDPLVFWLNVVSVFVIVTCIEIIWDIRDIEGDRLTGTRTVPNTFGVTAAKATCLALMGAYLLWFYSQITPPPALMAAHAIMIGIICFAKPERHYSYYQSLVMLWIVLSLLTILA